MEMSVKISMAVAMTMTVSLRLGECIRLRQLLGVYLDEDIGKVLSIDLTELLPWVDFDFVEASCMGAHSKNCY